MWKISVLCILGLMISACTINQKVQPVSLLVGKDVCIVENPAVRSGFLSEFQRELVRKGYKVKLLSPGSGVGDCETTSIYLAKWSWDLAIYMAYASIKVYKNGVLEGEALYDATGGGANMSKFIDGETKVRELVNQLFP